MLPDLKNKRGGVIIPTENIPLLQEMAYVRYYKDIVSYLKDVKMKEEKEFKKLKVSFFNQRISFVFYFMKHNGYNIEHLNLKLVNSNKLKFIILTLLFSSGVGKAARVSMLLQRRMYAA